ncbi:MAG TPA: M1 family metallopeptidase [Acidimicrobiales bacterium]
MVAVAALCGATVGLAAPVAYAADPFTPGSPGLGDPFFPNAGNGGYDVTHYDLALTYEPSTNQLTGTAVITATATQNLSRFDLDLRGFRIFRVLVNGVGAGFARSGDEELVITPPAGLRSGTTFTVTIDYAGPPAVVTDPDQSIEGWVPTDDGAFVVGEPQGSPGWYPVNDNPRDKATYDFTISVPAGLTAMANGVLVSNATSGGRTKWVWRETDPMAPYLATATLGRFDLTRSTTSGIPTYVAVDPQLPKGQVLSKLPAAVEFFTSIYGPYPFNAVGAIVDRAKTVGYSLETQTKPVFDRMPDETTLVHELSHMWFGDSVTLTTWPDIWLHEGFATWSEWIWSEHQGNKSAAQQFKQLYSTPAQDTAFWTPPAGDPGTPLSLFDGTIYARGAMTLEALREKIGDSTFSRLLRDWATQHRYGNVTTAQFIALADRLAGTDLARFFDVWLYQPAKPTQW